MVETELGSALPATRQGNNLLLLSPLETVEGLGKNNQ